MVCVDFGSGHNPKEGYLACDMTGSPALDIAFDPENYRMVDVPDSSVDRIHMRNVIHHIPDQRRLCAELHRVAKAGCIIEVEDCAQEFYAINTVLDVIWYRYVIHRPEVKVFAKYRDYRKEFRALFTEVMHRVEDVKQFSMFRKGK